MNNAALGVAMVLAASMLWGTTGTAQGLASGQLSSTWFGALRLAVAAAFFALYAVAAVPRRRGPLPLVGLAAAGVCMAVYNLAFFAGVRDAGVAVGTAVAIGSGPVWAAILQALVQRQAPSASWWLGTALAVAGGVLLTAGSGADVRAGTAGIALCLLSGLSYAGYTLIGKRLGQALPAGTITLWAFALAAVLAAPAAWVDAGAPALAAADIAAVVYVGVVASGVAYLLFGHALTRISAATGVTLALGEPVTAFALAVLVLGERPSAAALGGLVLVVAGVLVVIRSELSAPGIAGRGRPAR